MNTILLFTIFAIAIFLNIPIAFALLISAAGVILVSDIISINLLVQTLFTAADSFALLAVPFFILAGNIMMTGGISKRLINFSTVMLGHVRGSLGLITAFSSMIFAALSGSAIATSAAIGGIMIPAMIDDGYDKGFAASLAASSGSLGPLIPPSILFVIYGVATKVSVSDLFIAGIIPGIMVTAVLMIFSYFSAKIKGFGTVTPKSSSKEKWEGFKNAVWALLMPVIILGGIYGGVFTPTEAAVTACVYGLIVALFIHKEATLRDLLEIFKDTAATVSGLAIVIGGATIWGKILTIEGIPTLLAEFITGITTSKVVIMLFINLILFITGMFIDPTPAIIILAPILLPIAKMLEIHPVHFGVIMVLNLVIGFCTPPVGLSIFVTSKIADIQLEETFKWLFPMIGAILFVLMLVTFIPDLSLLILASK